MFSTNISPQYFLQDTAVELGFVLLLKRLRKEREIEVIYGAILRSSSSPIDGCSFGKVGGKEVNLVAHIFRLMEEQKLRVVDVFRRLDTDDSDTITKQEFRDAVKVCLK